MMKRLLLLSLVVLVTALGVLADGESRPSTPAERSFYAHFYEVCEGALPPGPVGWQETSRHDTTPPEDVGVGCGQQPMAADYNIWWEDRARIEAAEQAAMEEYAVLQAQPEDPRIAELSRKRDALYPAFGDAIERGDMAAAERVQQQIEPLNAELTRLLGIREQAANAITRKHTIRDGRLVVRVSANFFTHEFYRDAKPLAPIAGFVTWRYDGDTDAFNSVWNEGQTIVFLGNWKEKRSDGGQRYLEAAINPKLPATRIQALYVSVEGTDDHARAYLEKIDWNAFRGLMK